MSAPYYSDPEAGITIYHGDAIALLPHLGEVDAMITDPPYSDHVHNNSQRGDMGADGFVKSARDLGFASLSDALRAALLTYAATSVRRWSVVFSDVESCHLWRQCEPLEYLRTAFWRRRGGAPQFTGDRPAAACEAITLLHPKGRKRWNGGGKQGFYETPIVSARASYGTEFRGHPTQKPEQLMEELIADFTDPGELVIDPCMGSGTTLIAAKRLGRRAIGIELKEEHCASAVARLAQGVLCV